MASGNGAVSIDANNDLIYTRGIGDPNIYFGFSEAVTINYTIDDGTGAPSVATVSLTVAGARETITGGPGNDLLRGSRYGEVLFGFDGDDTLNGGGGLDILRGGEGNDFYIVNNIETIVDFSTRHDTIRLNHYIFAGFKAGNLDDEAFYRGAAATEADDRIIYNAATGALYFDSDGTGSATQVQFAVLSPNLALGYGHFEIV